MKSRPLDFLRRMFRVQYRLSVLFEGETTPRHTYGKDGMLLRRMAHSTANAQYWTLYRKGPLWLPEHEVDSSFNG